MANWCTNDVIFHGEKANILTMWVLIEQAFTKEFKELIRTKFERADTNWCGYLVFMFGGSVDGVTLNKGHLIEDPSSEHISCRGFLEGDPELSPDKKEIRLFVESAWLPLSELWQLMADLCEVEVDYVAEEPGCGIYINTDVSGRYFIDRYILFDENTGCDYFDTEENVLMAFKDLTKQSAGTFAEAKELAKDMDGIELYEFITNY